MTYAHLFEPIDVGTMRLHNRVMLPPHASAIGNIWGSDDEARRNIAYFERRCADDGVAWVGSLSTHLRNTVVPGFDPTGVGAATIGHFRLPYFVERVQQFADSLHALGTAVTMQMVHQGGMPHAPSPVMSAPTINLVPHVLTETEIAWFVREYAESAQLAQQGRADGVELHLNHDDLHEWFLSPYTNRRTDAYGGSLENRTRFAVECLRAIRDIVGDSMTVGIRLNIREELPEGYDVAGGVELAQYFESTGLIDYVHGVIGSPWGNPSYIQPTQFTPGEFAPYAGELKRALSIPVVHTGRINHPDVAESILAAGHADIVGMARAHIADGDLLAKARGGRADEIRPCVGGNDCISRRYVEGLPFACAVNPGTSHEVDGPWLLRAPKRRLLVVGGGPAGMELAALAAENGLDTTLWEAEPDLGGQLRYVVRVPRHEGFAQYLDWQTARLKRTGVDVATGTLATPDLIHAFAADVVAIATGARSRVPAIEGVDRAFDSRDVLAGRVNLGHRVLVVAEDDHVPPLSVADHLATAGHEVTVVYPTSQPAPLVGRYSIGAILGRLDAAGVTLRPMEQVLGIEEHTVVTRNVYSWRTQVLGEFDSIVLACGSVSESSLYDALRDELADLHVLGDAYAPRRLVFATQQAHALAQQLVTTDRY